MKAGFIGMGNMGASIARDLARSDHELMVYDVRPEILEEFKKLGSRIALSPAEMASQSDVIGVCVRTDEQFLDVLEGENGILSGARPNLIVAVHSTVHLGTLKAASERAAASGVSLVDAPVSRGTNAPKTKAINFMLGGTPEDVAQVAKFVEPAALKTIEAGPLGSALSLKICNNVITYMMTVTMRDVYHLAEASGTDLNKLAELLSSNGGGSPNMLYSIGRRAGSGARTEHVIDGAEVNAALGEKDLSCALELAEELGVSLPAVVFGRGKIRDVMLELFS